MVHPHLNPVRLKAIHDIVHAMDREQDAESEQSSDAGDGFVDPEFNHLHNWSLAHLIADTPDADRAAMRHRGSQDEPSDEELDVTIPHPVLPSSSSLGPDEMLEATRRVKEEAKLPESTSESLRQVVEQLYRMGVQPRRRSFLILRVGPDGVTGWAYNIHNSTMAAFQGRLLRCLSWINARLHLLYTCLLHKAGLRHACPGRILSLHPIRVPIPGNDLIQYLNQAFQEGRARNGQGKSQRFDRKLDSTVLPCVSMEHTNNESRRLITWGARWFAAAHVHGTTEVPTGIRAAALDPEALPLPLRIAWKQRLVRWATLRGSGAANSLRHARTMPLIPIAVPALLFFSVPPLIIGKAVLKHQDSATSTQTLSVVSPAVSSSMSPHGFGASNTSSGSRGHAHMPSSMPQSGAHSGAPLTIRAPSTSTVTYSENSPSSAVPHLPHASPAAHASMTVPSAARSNPAPFMSALALARLRASGSLVRHAPQPRVSRVSLDKLAELEANQASQHGNGRGSSIHGREQTGSGTGIEGSAPKSLNADTGKGPYEGSGLARVSEERDTGSEHHSDARSSGRDGRRRDPLRPRAEDMAGEAEGDGSSPSEELVSSTGGSEGVQDRRLSATSHGSGPIISRLISYLDLPKGKSDGWVDEEAEEAEAALRGDLSEELKYRTMGEVLQMAATAGVKATWLPGSLHRDALLQHGIQVRCIGLVHSSSAQPSSCPSTFSSSFRRLLLLLLLRRQALVLTRRLAAWEHRRKRLKALLHASRCHFPPVLPSRLSSLLLNLALLAGLPSPPFAEDSPPPKGSRPQPLRLISAVSSPQAGSGQDSPFAELDFLSMETCEAVFASSPRVAVGRFQFCTENWRGRRVGAVATASREAAAGASENTSQHGSLASDSWLDSMFLQFFTAHVEVVLGAELIASVFYDAAGRKVSDYGIPEGRTTTASPMSPQDAPADSPPVVSIAYVSLLLSVCGVAWQLSLHVVPSLLLTAAAAAPCQEICVPPQAGSPARFLDMGCAHHELRGAGLLLR